MQIIICWGGCLLSSCAATYDLENGTTVLKKKFRNISRFDPEIYALIDTNYFYKGVGTCTSNRGMTEFREHKEDLDWLKLQFYSGGYVRTLSKFRKRVTSDPAKSGMRGVLYKENGKFWLDHQAGTQDGHVILYSYKLKVEGDRIYLMLKPSITANMFFFNRVLLVMFMRKRGGFLRTGKDFGRTGRAVLLRYQSAKKITSW